MANNMPNLKKMYQDEVAPALMQKFGYKSTMQIPRLDKIVINRVFKADELFFAAAHYL